MILDPPKTDKHLVFAEDFRTETQRLMALLNT
jgi:hypothetical protein